MKNNSTILFSEVNKNLERMINMKLKKEELQSCNAKAEEIFKTIIEKGDILELANDYGEENSYNSSCCSVDIEYEEHGELLYHRYTLAQISENHKYLHCSGCNSKLSIVDFSSNFLDQSIPGAIKFLNNYLQAGLCLKDLEVPQKKPVILTKIRRLNNEYLKQCPDIHEAINDDLDVFCDGDPFVEEILNKKRRNK
ncbi:MAG: hypothetical protein CI948_2706 [Halanaerobium sp.]|nr:MAG: hypothetical protein CI948_2706 [Halanaerobium sp.]